MTQTETKRDEKSTQTNHIHQANTLSPSFGIFESNKNVASPSLNVDLPPLSPLSTITTVTDRSSNVDEYVLTSSSNESVNQVSM